MLRRWGDRFGVGGFEQILWADLYALPASVYKGLIFQVMNVGPPPGTLMTSDGVRWKPLNGHAVLASHNTDATKTDADNTEAVLFSALVNGGLMGPNGHLRVTSLWSYSATAIGKEIKLYLGSTFFFNRQQAIAANVTLTQQYNIWNRNNEASQIATPNDTSFTSFSADDTAVATGAVNTAIDQTLTLAGRWVTAGTGSLSLTLRAATVELFA